MSELFMMGRRAYEPCSEEYGHILVLQVNVPVVYLLSGSDTVTTEALSCAHILKSPVGSSLYLDD